MEEPCQDLSILQALEVMVHAYNHTIEPVKNELWAIRQKLNEIEKEVYKIKTEVNLKGALDGLEKELKTLANYVPGERFRPESDPKFKDKEELAEVVYKPHALHFAYIRRSIVSLNIIPCHLTLPN
jgi:hypothetical protein